MKATIAKLLKGWRDRNNCSQSEAARRLGVNVRTLQDWEQGRRRPVGLADQVLREKLAK